MPISARYSPEHAFLDRCVVACDFSALIPAGAAINPMVAETQFGTESNAGVPTPRLEIYLNAPGNMAPAPRDWYVDPRVTLWKPGWFWGEVGGVFAWGQGTAGIGAVGIPVLLLGTAARGKQCYSVVTGGVPGVDYLFVWYVVDTLGNRWSRSIPVLCGPTQ